VKKIGLCAVLAGVAAGVATLFGTVNGTASALRAGHKTAAVMSGQPKFAQESSSVVGGAGQVKFACQARATRRCFGPDQIRAAYGVQTLLNHGITGAGRTIVIIDAYGSSTIAADLATFDTTWGKIVYEYGLVGSVMYALFFYVAKGAKGLRFAMVHTIFCSVVCSIRPFLCRLRRWSYGAGGRLAQ